MQDNNVVGIMVVDITACPWPHSDNIWTETASPAVPARRAGVWLAEKWKDSPGLLSTILDYRRNQKLAGGEQVVGIST